MGASGNEPGDRPGFSDLDASTDPDTPAAESQLSGAPGPIEEVLAEPEIKAPAEVQPAIGAVDLLSLCRKGGATASPPPSVTP
jgi:hypothetical protein